MIQVSRSLLRVVRGVFRRARIGVPTSGPGRHMLVQSGSDGLRIRGLFPDVAIEYHEPGGRHVEQFVLPVEFLDDCEGRKDEPVTLEATGPDRAAASFTDGGVPQIHSYPLERVLGLKGFPELPEQGAEFAANEPGLLEALRNALPVVDRQPSRYALSCLQLRSAGSTECGGQIAATDGRQVLLQSGFRFPWQGELLIPAAAVLKSPELPADQPVTVGRLDPWVLFRVGRWTLGLRRQDGRFPRIDDVIPGQATIATRLRLDEEDAQFLMRAIPKLPRDDSSNHPVTVELNGRVAIRARGENSPATELLLTRSSYTGDPLTFVTNRTFLGRALDLGLRELALSGPEKPVLCGDERRKFVWALLAQENSVKADPAAIQVASVASPSPTPIYINGISRTPRPRREKPLPKHTAQTDTRESTAESASTASIKPPSPIDQAEALRSVLRDALARTSELIASLRRQKKQTRLMKTTLDSLKELQRVAG